MGASKPSHHSKGQLACKDLERVREGNWEGWDGIRSLFVELTGASLGPRVGRQVQGGTKRFAFGMSGNL